MAYRFNKTEPLDSAFRRIALEQIDKAITALNATDEPQENVHEVRKVVKRLRALLNLTRKATGQKFYKTENTRFRDISRILSQTRDRHVMLQTLTHLQSKTDDPDIPPALLAIRAKLSDQIDKESNGSTPISAALDAFTEARKEFKNLPKKNIHRDQLLQGFSDNYRKCRKSMKKAFKAHDATHFHDWRKLLQRHWRHLKLLREWYPSVSNAQIALARELSEILGTHNDVDILQSFVQRNIDAEEVPAIKSFLNLCEREKTHCRKLAQPMGERLLENDTDQFLARIKRNSKIQESKTQSQSNHA